MRFPVRVPYTVSAPWEQPRPLGSKNPTHVHGAIDLAVPTGSEIYAPESGLLYYHWQVRTKPDMTSDWYWDDRRWYAFSNYFFDVWGGLLILEAYTGRTHVFAHIEGDCIFGELGRRASDIEYRDAEGVHFISNLAHPVMTLEGDRIGRSGNAGFSTGPHIHWEIHNKRVWTPHENRVDPAKLFELDAVR
jgi:hypothetical protein